MWAPTGPSTSDTIVARSPARSRERAHADAVAELYDAGGALREITCAAALADHLRTGITALPGRVIPRDDTGDDPGARLGKARERLTRMANLPEETERHMA